MPTENPTNAMSKLKDLESIASLESELAGVCTIVRQQNYELRDAQRRLRDAQESTEASRRADLAINDWKAEQQKLEADTLQLRLEQEKERMSMRTEIEAVRAGKYNLQEKFEQTQVAMNTLSERAAQNVRRLEEERNGLKEKLEQMRSAVESLLKFSANNANRFQDELGALQSENANLIKHLLVEKTQNIEYVRCLNDELERLWSENTNLKEALSIANIKLENIDFLSMTNIAETADKYRLEAEDARRKLYLLNSAVEGKLPMSYETELTLKIKDEAIKSLGEQITDLQAGYARAEMRHTQESTDHCDFINDLREQVFFQESLIALMKHKSSHLISMQGLESHYQGTIKELRQAFNKEVIAKESLAKELEDTKTNLELSISSALRIEMETKPLQEANDRHEEITQRTRAHAKRLYDRLLALERMGSKERHMEILTAKNEIITNLMQEIEGLREENKKLEEVEALRKRAAVLDFMSLNIDASKERLMAARLEFAEKELEKIPVNPMLKFVTNPAKWPAERIAQQVQVEVEGEEFKEDNNIEGDPTVCGDDLQEPDYSQVPPGDDDFPPKEEKIVPVFEPSSLDQTPLWTSMEEKPKLYGPRDWKGKKPMYAKPQGGILTPPDTPLFA